METNQEIPDFLQRYVPEGVTADNLKFETDSDFEEEAAGGGNKGDGANTDNFAGNDFGNWGAADENTHAAGNDTGTWGVNTAPAAW